MLRPVLLDSLSFPPQTNLQTVKRKLAPLRIVGPVILMVACSDPVFSDMSDSTFVRTMVALRKLPVGQPDTTLRVRQRDSILKAFGVTAAQIESTTVRLAGDPVRALEVWRAIENPRPPVTPP